MRRLEADCCIAGGGPAAIMLGYLLTRQGVDVMVQEKHADFFRDFRGATVHPSTLEAFAEMGLLESLLQRPPQRTETLGSVSSDRLIVMINRGDCRRCALPLPKGSDAAMRAAGLEAFRRWI